MKKLLFVCSGNVFRSLSAEYLLKQYLQNQAITEWSISSAGIVHNPDVIDPKVLSTLNELGITNINHQPRLVTKKILENCDFIISMADYHQEYLENEFHTPSFLFNEIAIGEPISVLDVKDCVPDYQVHRDKVEDYIETTIKDLHEKMPTFFKNISTK